MRSAKAMTRQLMERNAYPRIQSQEAPAEIEMRFAPGAA